MLKVNKLFPCYKYANNDFFLLNKLNFDIFFLKNKEQLNKNLHFTSNLDEALKNTKIILICVNTPTKRYGEGANKAFDLKFIENVTRQIAEYYNEIELSEEVIIVEKSTVPVCTSKYIKEILQENQNNFKSNKEKFIILSNPEFLAEDNENKIIPNVILLFT